jgi:hypothetical protein
MRASEIEDLKAGTFTQDCPAMILSNGDPDQPRHFSGPGCLSLDEHGQLQLVLYDPGHDPDPRALIRTSGVGEWVAESDIYELEATDLSGRIWRSINLTVGVNVHVARPGAVVRAHLDSLSSEADWEHGGSDWMSLFFPHRVEAPRNVSTITTVEETDRKGQRRGSECDVWAFSCGNLHMRMRFRDESFEISASVEEGASLEDLGAIIEETIWFTLGQPVRADIVRYRRAGREGITIHSRGRDDALASAMPPYHIRIPDSASVLGEMFCKYFKHVAVDRDGRYHPLSVLIRKALRAETGTVEEAALARCVAIEGIVDLEFPDRGKPSDEVLEAVSTLKELLEDHLESSPIKSRVEGFFGSVRGRSSRTALHTLAEQKVITDDQLEAWETLRHVAAHGREYQLPPREVLELTEKLRVLMSRLVFEGIGYTGTYTDYGTRGWPVQSHKSPDVALSEGETV